MRLEASEYETLASEILTWARGICEGEIETSAASANTRAALALERHGFVRDDFEALVYARNLGEPIVAPNLPAGFQVRHVLEHEFAERAEVHRDAWNSTKLTVEDYVRIRLMPGFRADLDLVVATPEQGFASYCSVWLAGGIGQFEPVGTRAAHRRQGLGQAVILEGFRRLQALGAHTAIVHSQPNNRAFYESCGFRVVSHEHGSVHRG